ncbi:MAG: hypothetical protein IJ643_07865 [Eubacterium sp.]|nr:hypothetical protein [Eubacterium sp.]
MEVKVSEALSRLRKSDKKIKIAVILGLVGILLIGASEVMPKKSVEPKAQEMSCTEYTAELESKTQQIVASISGVGKCRVMITLKNSNENIYAKNNTENTNDGHYSSESEYVLYDGENGESPVLIKEFYPEIKGVAVVCSGADNTVVRENVINCISSLYGISTAKISVSKLKD